MTFLPFGGIEMPRSTIGPLIMKRVEKGLFDLGYSTFESCLLVGGVKARRARKIWQNGCWRTATFGVGYSTSGAFFIRLAFGLRTAVIGRIWNAILPENLLHLQNDELNWFVGQGRTGRIGFEEIGSEFVLDPRFALDFDLSCLLLRLNDEFLAAVTRTPIYLSFLDERKAGFNPDHGILRPIMLEIAGCSFGLVVVNDQLNEARGLNPPDSDYDGWQFGAYGLQKSLGDEIIFSEVVRRIKEFRKSGIFMEWRSELDALTCADP